MDAPSPDVIYERPHSKIGEIGQDKNRRIQSTFMGAPYTGRHLWMPLEWTSLMDAPGILPCIKSNMIHKWFS